MMKDYHINVFYSQEDEGYIADIPDLKYCSAFGETPEEALQEVLIAKVAFLETVRERKANAAVNVSPRNSFKKLKLKRHKKLLHMTVRQTVRVIQSP